MNSRIPQTCVLDDSQPSGHSQRNLLPAGDVLVILSIRLEGRSMLRKALRGCVSKALPRDRKVCTRTSMMLWAEGRDLGGRCPAVALP